MGDYVPPFTPGDTITLQASATITGGQLVYVSGAGTVAPTAGANAAWLGVAATDATSGQKVAVYTEGVHNIAVAAAVAAGDVLMAAASGQVTPLSGTTYSQVVGVALTAQASTGQTARVALRS